MTDMQNLVPTGLIVLGAILVTWLIMFFATKEKNRMVITASTIVYLVLPLLAIWGLINLTKIAFATPLPPIDVPRVTGQAGAIRNDILNSMNAEGFQSVQTSWSNVTAPITQWWNAQTANGGVLRMPFTAAEIQSMRVAVVSLWLLVIILMISWFGKAFGLWCIL